MQIGSSMSALQSQAMDYKQVSKMYEAKRRADNITLENIKQLRDPKEQLQKVAEEMEALFVKMMYKQMKQNVQKSGFIDGGFAEKIFDDMLTDEYAKVSVRNSSFGIAKMIYDQFSKTV